MTKAKHARGTRRYPSDRLQRRSTNRFDPLPEKLPFIRLRHGQTLWLLNELGYRGTVSESAFYEYIKSLRKLGIPFGRIKFRSKHSKWLAEYSYCHLMELAMTLSLRVYHVVPDAVLMGIIRYRAQLYRLYRHAYAQSRTGAGKPKLIRINSRKPIELRGLFLDLKIQFAGGHLERFGPPSLLSPAKALARFGESALSAPAFVPFNLSLLSEQVVALALRAPDIRSGRRKSLISTVRRARPSH